MNVQQIYTGCLSHAAYYVESEGQVALFDPLKDIAPYLEQLAHLQHRLCYVMETHFHADFVSGHQDLAAATGAVIVYGPKAEPQFEALVAHDREVFQLGQGRIEVLHTPGHTPESCCYLLYHTPNEPPFALISGDTLFIGNVGRPDLAQHVDSNFQPEQLARDLYRSLHQVILPLPDNITVYPNHGAGSACGKNMSRETSDTLGHQKMVNPGLRTDWNEREFVAWVLEGQPATPRYFPHNVRLNKMGSRAYQDIILTGCKALDVAQAFALQQQGALLVDVRAAEAFGSCHVAGSLQLGSHGQLASWAGELIQPLDHALVVVAADAQQAEQTISRFTRVGFSNIQGYITDIDAWQQAGYPTTSVYRVSPESLLVLEEQKIQEADFYLLDVRRPDEYVNDRLWDAHHIPLRELPDRWTELPTDRMLLIYCAGGYRSMIAASYLLRMGLTHVADVEGGIQAVQAIDTGHVIYRTDAVMV